MQTEVILKSYDVAVIGGGLSGVCAAITSARGGARTLLINDRPVLGGNSSAEIGVLVQGADELGHFKNSRETGLIDELFARNINFPNPKLSPSIWSLVLWEACQNEENLTLMQNAMAYEPDVVDGCIVSVKAEQLSTERSYKISADVFVEASGDGRVAFEAGADFKTGRESISEFNEPLALPESDSKTMGNTIYIRIRDMGKPVDFTPPKWAYVFENDDDFPGEWKDCPHNIQSLFTPSGGYWWMEFGGECDIIGDAENIRDELYKIVIGVWDHIKNRGDHGAENFVLESVGTVPGRRESRRFLGDYIMTQQDIQSLKQFPDAVAYGGWHLDLHNPAGVLGKGQRYWSGRVLQGRYTIPYRSLYSRNVTNLLLAGRLISATHIAMGSTRVMATCAMMGEAVGNAAAMCVSRDILPVELGQKHIRGLQQKLLDSDCYIPGLVAEDKDDLVKAAKIFASSTAVMPTLKPEKYVPLDNSRCQNILLSAGEFSSIILPLENNSDQPQQATMRIFKRKVIDDLCDSPELISTTVVVAPGRGDIKFEFEPFMLEGCEIYGLSLDANENLAWGFTSEECIGTQAGIEIDQIFTEPGVEVYYHRIRGSHCFELQRENDIYSASEILTGVNRPEKRSNIWISEMALHQEIQLQWDRPIKFDLLELTFNNDLDITREAWAEKMCASALVRNYTVVATTEDGKEIPLIEVCDNIYRKRVHRLEEHITAAAIKLRIESTWGEKYASMFAVRVFDSK